VFAEFAVVGAEGGEEVGIDVEFAGDLVADEDRDDDFRFGFEGTGEIAAIGIDVINHDGFTTGGGGATDTLIERDPGVGSHGALEGAENEDVVITFLFEHVETDPVVTGEPFAEEGYDGVHESVSGCGSYSECIKARNEVCGIGVRCGHGD
jgi:hypothetical protein